MGLIGGDRTRSSSASCASDKNGKLNNTKRELPRTGCILVGPSHVIKDRKIIQMYKYFTEKLNYRDLRLFHIVSEIRIFQPRTSACAFYPVSDPEYHHDKEELQYF